MTRRRVDPKKDETARRSTKDALRKSEERLHLATESGKVGIWDWDVVADAISWTDSLFYIYGISKEQFLPTIEGFRTLVHPADRALVTRTVEDALDNLESCELEFRANHPDGRLLWLYSTCRIVRKNGRAVRMLGATIDVTERRLAEDKLRESDRRKDEFLATLAHELRNPLAPIRNSLYILRMRGGDDAEAHRIHEMIERQVNHIVRLVDDLLEVSRITRGKIELRRERVDLSDAIKSAIETSRPLIEAARHSLEVSLPSRSILLLADAVRLAQIFTNLLNNAAKYTDTGGTIWLTVKPDHRYVTISVRDNGIGIPPENLDRIFDLFTQLERTHDHAQGGLGIGLTLVQRLVEMHGGTVVAKSSGIGGGSEFVVRLPLFAASGMVPRAPSEETATLSEPAPQRRRVLVVDDNRDALHTLSMLIRMWGYDVRTAEDGVEAVEAAVAFLPQIILLDIGLPRLSGYEAAVRIRERLQGSALTLIALTGWGQEQDRKKARAAGFAHHLVKPVQPEALHELLAQLE